MESIYQEHKPAQIEETYSDLQKSFVTSVRTALSKLKTEISERNSDIEKNDQYIYGDLLERALRIPIGHDRTSVNWLRRTVEIHKTQFMGRPFQVISTYDTKDRDVQDEQEQQRIEIENKKQNVYAELRKNAIDAIIRDNGGHALFMEGAESASATGTFVIKTWYDEENKKYVLSPIEAVENCYALWNKDDFRSFDAFAYIHQVSKLYAIEQFGVPQDVAVSTLGEPLDFIGDQSTSPINSSQEMVTVMEITGKIEGWGTEKGKVKRVSPGKENNFNAVIVGDRVYKIIDDEKKLPRHYIFPNKRQRRRPWGMSDVSESARQINMTYVETMSDWRTVAAKVNFPKYKAFNFGPDAQLPKSKSRSVQVIPLGENQDIVELQQGDANQIDFRAQMDELKEQFVRETGISRVLFDDPSVTLNSNQALLTSMKPTSDIAETKKQLWGPIIQQMFVDALEVIAAYNDDFKELSDGSWELKVQWPSIMQTEDPVYQQMLLNRFNAGTMSLKSFLEKQGETKEEIDRLEEEMNNPLTAAVLGRQLPLLAQQLISPPQPATPEQNIRKNINVNSKEMDSDQIARLVAEATTSTTDDAVNTQQAPQNGPSNTPGVDSNGGTAAPAQITTQANNQDGQGVMSQPGSGATTTSAGGAVAQTNQNNGG